MIIGILLLISISVFATSIIIIATGLAGAFQERIITGAVIGTKGIISYSIITLILSFVSTSFLIIKISRRFSRFIN
tara:strand:- start:108 stop:335 length:228 start_codon:yes stop_codon:yes gene_type:complete